jgi:hypothetical protein
MPWRVNGHLESQPLELTDKALRWSSSVGSDL